MFLQMKTKVRALASVSLISFLASTSAAFAEGELNIYNWTDYTSQELIEKFEQETGIKVTLDTFDSNETLLAKLQSGATGYDIVVPSHNFVKIFVEENLIQPINASELEGYENVSENFKNSTWDAGNVYTIPWQWGTTAFTVNTDVVKGDINTYDILFNPAPEVQGKIGMFKSADEVTAMAELALGVPLCNETPEDMQKVLTLLEAQKPFVKTYSSEGILERLISGDVVVHQNWNGNSIRTRNENAAMAYAFPKEGVIAWADNVAVATGAPNYDNAIQFIEFLMKPENIALQSNFARYSNGIDGSMEFMAEELREAPELSPPADVNLVFSETCSEKAIDLQSRVWTQLLK